MSLSSAVLFALAMILLLFAVAAFVEARGPQARHRPRLRHAAYTLALGVYCSSWTFYGAVGSAVRDGWSYLPIYLGPILLLLFAPRFLSRLSHAVAEEQATTVSDFIAARFGHDVIVARLVTIIALMGTIPYIALQLRSIGNVLTTVSGHPVAVPAMIVAAVLLALFAVQFGARRFEVAGRNEGLLFAIALESLIKFVALLLVCGLAVILIRAAPTDDVSRGMATLSERFDPAHLSLEIGVIGLISVLAERFGAQCVVVAIDAARVSAHPVKWDVSIRSGTERAELDAIEWARQAQDRGAGEILLTSIDRDGTQSGYDLELVQRVSDAVHVPVIASGGAATPEHLVDALAAGADAVLAASIFHDGRTTVSEIKHALATAGIPVRIDAVPTQRGEP